MFCNIKIHFILSIFITTIGKNNTGGIVEKSNLLTWMLLDIRLMDVEVPAYCD